MKRLVLLLGMFLLVSATAVPALATVEISVTDSIGTYSLTGSSCGTNCSTGILSFSDADFEFLIQVGTSNGPAGGPAIMTFSTDLTALKPNSPLTISVSDTGYLLPSGGATLTQNMNTTTPALGSATGTLSGTGFYGTGGGNVFFCQKTSVCTDQTGTLSFTSFLNSNPGQTSGAPINFVSPFSLDEVMTATFTSSGAAQWEGNLAAIVVPEPASAVLLGGVLLILASLLRRKIVSV